MKKQTIAAVLTGLIVILSLLLPGCNNVVDPYSVQSGGRGIVTVSFSSGRAALSPESMDFDYYNFIFKKGDVIVVDENKNKNAAFTFSLETGSAYTLEVKAYKDGVSGSNLSAQGTAEFTVSSSGPTSVTVTLRGVLTGGGKGTFTYSIDYPAGAEIKELVLEIDAANSIDLTEGKVTTGGSISGTVDAEAGWYFLIAQLSKNGKTAGYANGVVIYPGQTTTYEATFEDEDFKAASEEPGNIGKRVYTWRGFNVEGACHYEDNDTSNPGFNFSTVGTYYFDRGRAIGTKYDSFKDANGIIRTDVLKLEPPKEINPAHYLLLQPDKPAINGYQPNTFIMTYPITESGTYNISMSIWVEESAEPVYLVWYAVPGGWNQFVAKTPPNEDGAPPENDIERGKWIDLAGGQWLTAGMEIAMGARSGGAGGGLQDATIYIRDLVMKKDGVIIPTDPDDFIIDPSNFTLVSGRTLELRASKEVASWSSGNTDVATVNNDGVVTAVNSGTAVITAVSNDDPPEYATATVKVIAKASKHIALTFDDGPWHPYTSSFQAILKGKAHATFFINGLRLEQTPEISRALLADGHELANHTYDHIFVGPDSIRMQSVADIRRELIKVQNAIESVTGRTTLFVRAPALLYTADQDPVYDTSNNIPDNEDQYEGPFMDAAASLGMSFIDASYHQLGNHDWDARSPQQILDRVKVVAKDDGILLLHDSYGNADNTMTALPWIIDWLIEEGYEILNVSEMVARKNVASLTPGRIYYDFINGVPESQGPVVLVSNVSIFNGSTNVSESEIVLSEVGEALQLTAEIAPVDSSLKKVYWYSDNDYAATVDENGKVTAVNAGTAVIRAVAGTIVGKVTVKVNVSSVSITETTWDVFDWPGKNGGNYAVEGSPYLSSNAAGEIINDFYSPVDGKIYSNVLKLSPPVGGYPNDPGIAGSLAMNYVIPYTGNYTLSMDIWIESEGKKVDLIWYEVDEWRPLGDKKWEEGVNCWNSGTASLRINQGVTIGLLAKGYMGAGLDDAVIYIKDLKLTYDGLVDPVIDIRSPAVPAGNPGITFEWVNGAVPLTVSVSSGELLSQNPVTVTKGSTVTLTASSSFTSYQWLIERKEVSATNTCTFTATEDCTILLWVDGGYSKGASITVFVE